MSTTHQTNSLHKGPFYREPLPKAIYQSIATTLELHELRTSLLTAQQAATILEAQLDSLILSGVQVSIDALESLHIAQADLAAAQSRALAWRTERNDARALLKAAERELEEMKRRNAWRGEKRRIASSSTDADVEMKGESSPNGRKAAKRVKLEEMIAYAKRRLSSRVAYSYDSQTEGERNASKHVEIEAWVANVTRRMSSQASAGVVEAQKPPKSAKLNAMLAGAKRRLSSHSRNRVEILGQKAAKRIRIEYWVAGVKRSASADPTTSAKTSLKKFKLDDSQLRTSPSSNATNTEQKQWTFMENFESKSAAYLAKLKRDNVVFLAELEQKLRKTKFF